MEGSSNKFVSKLKRFGLELFSFLTSKIFLKNLAGILAMMLVAFLFTTMWMKCYTNHGESMHMENFTGLHLYDAQEIAQDKGYTIVVDSISGNENQKPLTVTDQNPKPDALVKEKRTVYLTYIKEVKEKTTAPQLVGRIENYTTYKKALKGAKLKAKMIEEKYNAKLSPGTILEVFYDGKNITKELKDEKPLKFDIYTELRFIISKRGTDNVKVPSLVCKTYSKGKFILESSNLNYGSIVRDQTVTDKDKAYIWKQEPEQGSLRFGAQVDIWITQNFPDGCDGLINPVEDPQESPEGEDDDEEF